MNSYKDEFPNNLRITQIEKLIVNIFGENHLKIKNFDDLKNAIKIGKVSLNFIYKPEELKDFFSYQNFGFFNGIRNIKNVGVLLYLIYMLIYLNDFKFLIAIPIVYIINYIILRFWKNKLLTTIILISIIQILCHFLNLSSNYKIFLTLYVILHSITISAYSTFLEQRFSQDEIIFDYGIESNIIINIYDSYTKKTIKLE